jgi:hypothetical protein
MGRRITDVTSAEFDALFTGFEHTAYRLETLQAYSPMIRRKTSGSA